MSVLSLFFLKDILKTHVALVKQRIKIAPLKQISPAFPYLLTGKEKLFTQKPSLKAVSI